MGLFQKVTGYGNGKKQEEKKKKEDSQHTKNARPSSHDPHTKGQGRKNSDQNTRKGHLERSNRYRGKTNNK